MAGRQQQVIKKNNGGLLMTEHAAISSKDLVRAIRSCKITIAGNRKLKIYGRLSCISGKKMKKCNG